MRVGENGFFVALFECRPTFR